MRRALALAAAAAVLAALPPAVMAAEVDLAINTARVWLTTMQELAAAVNNATSSAGQPPVDTNVTITRAHSMQVEGYMVAASNGQVADIASAITAFQADNLETGYTMPMVQFPFGWSPSEVFYNEPSLADTPLRLDACAIAGILAGNITVWDAPELQALNPGVELPTDDITLVYLNLSMPITMSLTSYLSDNCPAWTLGVVDDLGPVVEGNANLVPSTDVEYNWKAVNSTRGAICIGASMPVGQYVEQYPDAMQTAVLRVASGDFVPPNGDLDSAAVAELVLLAPFPADPSADWSAFNSRSPGVYPVLYWGFATLAHNLTSEGDRGQYIRDTAGYLLTEEGQVLVGGTNEYPLPAELMPVAMQTWAGIEVASDVDTGIPTPLKSPAASTPAPAPPTPPSGALAMAGGVPLLAAAAAALLAAILA